MVGDDFSVVGPVEEFLSHLSALGRSLNTTSAYGHDLRDFFRFLAGRPGVFRLAIHWL